MKTKPPPIEKDAGHYTGVSENNKPSQATFSTSVYRRRAVFARQKHLRLVHDRDNLAEKTLQKAEQEIRENPVRLPLWCFRLAQEINLGRLPYAATWERVEAAAYEGGASPRWVRRCTYHGISAAQHSHRPTIKLALLAAEGCQ